MRQWQKAEGWETERKPNLQQKMALATLHPANLSGSCPDRIYTGTNRLQLLGYMECPIAVLKKGCSALRKKGCFRHLVIYIRSTRTRVLTSLPGCPTFILQGAALKLRLLSCFCSWGVGKHWKSTFSPPPPFQPTLHNFPFSLPRQVRYNSPPLICKCALEEKRA